MDWFQNSYFSEPSCTPSTPRTFLLAYSTDLDDSSVAYRLWDADQYLYGVPYWNTYATVRLDMKNEEDIRYFEELSAFEQHLDSNFPDPSLGYMDIKTGSNMFDVIKKFLKNTVSLCGSTILIFAKRYPNEIEVEDLIGELQKNHVFVYIIASDTPSGGSNPSAMFNVATKTNGYCVFSADFWMPYPNVDAENVVTRSSQIAASKFTVSGKGRQTVPFKILGDPGGSDIIQAETVFQDHKVDGSLISLNYTVSDEFGKEQQLSPYFYYINEYTGSLTYFRVNNTVQYYYNIDYEYQEGRKEVMVVRMYSEKYVPDNWLPFNN